uniref:Glyco_hydro_38C domain-containing protein n=1 Tax=Bursaphelenchus xylophilus TaxID=6326 RepID=A0A1I7RWG5_BURXY
MAWKRAPRPPDHSVLFPPSFGREDYSEQFFFGQTFLVDYLGSQRPVEDEKLFHAKVLDKSKRLRGYHTIKSANLTSISELTLALSDQFAYENYQLMTGTISRSDQKVENQLTFPQQLIPNSLYTFVLEDFDIS